MLKIEKLCANIGDKKIIKDLSLEFKKGEIHAIMGRNGCGKSTLSKVIAGHPDYEVTSGDVLLMNEKGQYESILELEPEERAYKGIFIGFQTPVSIAGLDNESFLRTVYNHLQERQGKIRIDAFDFHEFITSKMEKLGMSEEFLTRGLNIGFSGGERKKNEMLQMSLLDPSLAILDEIDSGLDVDALSIICRDLLGLKTQKNCLILITHYNRILKHIKPDFVHVMSDGNVVLSSSDAAIAQEIEEQGFDKFIQAGGR
ncbi:MAG: Fe-S cluster assembly ATPase SufC [Spirochaetia bacterium]